MPPVFELNPTVVPEQTGDPDQLTQIVPATFAARYCLHRGIKLEEFEETLFRRALYRPAKFLRPLLGRLTDYFSADRAFIAMVGRARNMDDVEAAMVDFADCRSRYRLLRKRLKLRVSASTVWMLSNRLMKAPPPPAPMLLTTRAALPPQAKAWRDAATALAASNSAAARSNRTMGETEISRLRGEVERLSAQCELMKRALGLFGEPQNPPPSYT